MFQILMAGLVVEIRNRYSYVEKQCKDWVCLQTEHADIVAEASEEEILREQTRARFAPSLELCESICIYRAIARELTAFSAFVMHGAAVELDGQAYVFIAKSGVGKTTHTKLWIKCFPDRAAYINGDKPVMRWQGDRLFAYGTPWMGKEGYGCSGFAPVKAICMLERGEENQIERADDAVIVSRLFHQVLLPEEASEMELFMEMMDRMVREIPFYVLKCNISDEAAQLACRVMSRDGVGEYAEV